MEFPIDVKKDSYANWFYTKKQIRRYFPVDSGALNVPILPVLIWQKYDYFNINFAMILPNNQEYFHNGNILPKEMLQISYPETPEFKWSTYKNKAGDEFSTTFQLWELYGLNHYTKDNKPICQDFPEYYGTIHREMDEYFIMDENTDLHRIRDYIPANYLAVKSWAYYRDYCLENKIQLFADLNQYFHYSLLDGDVNYKGNSAE
jgi:hypothetical protein